jgi:hypothetical protein
MPPAGSDSISTVYSPAGGFGAVSEGAVVDFCAGGAGGFNGTLRGAVEQAAKSSNRGKRKSHGQRRSMGNNLT